MNLEFECADGMSYAFDVVALTMCIVIHGIYAPFVTCSMMGSMNDPIHDRIAHEHVGMRHVDFCPQNTMSIRKFTCPHSAKQV